jgi:hypothetical protein
MYVHNLKLTFVNDVDPKNIFMNTGFSVSTDSASPDPNFDQNLKMGNVLSELLIY